MRLVPSGEPNVRIFPLDLTVFARNAPSVCSAAIVALLRLQMDLRQSVCRQRDGGCAAGIADGVIAGRRASARHEEGARSDARPSRPRPESGRRDVGCADVNPSHRERAELLNGCSVAPFEDGQVSHADHRPKMLRGALPHVHDEVRGHVVVRLPPPAKCMTSLSTGSPAIMPRDMHICSCVPLPVRQYPGVSWWWGGISAFVKVCLSSPPVEPADLEPAAYRNTFCNLLHVPPMNVDGSVALVEW